MLEKSAGAIIFHRSKDKIEYLLLKHDLGHWDFPKGHVEKDETLVDAARREIKEETGLSRIIFFPDFKKHIQYFYKWERENRFKVVTFFLGESKVRRVKVSKEHLGYQWVSFAKAMEVCQLQNQKGLLLKANKFLIEKGFHTS